MLILLDSIVAENLDVDVDADVAFVPVCVLGTGELQFGSFFFVKYLT